MKTVDIEIAVANYFRPRVNIVVPNVSWAFSHYEMDLVVVTRSNFVYEIEIKASKSDLIADKKKRHNHDCDKIKYLLFAIPESLIGSVDHIPDDAGIIVCKNPYRRIEVSMFRRPKKRNHYELEPNERYLLARLGYLRMWDLKNKLNRVKAALM